MGSKILITENSICACALTEFFSSVGVEDSLLTVASQYIGSDLEILLYSKPWCAYFGTEFERYRHYAFTDFEAFLKLRLNK